MCFRDFLTLTVATAVWSVLLACPAEERTFFSVAKPRNFAHRGGAQVAPENTLFAYRRALELGADIIELDVYSTVDNHIVALHDRTVNRTTDGRGDVKKLTLAELKKLDAAYRFSPDRGVTFPLRGKGITVPTLEEVFREFPNVPVNIEIKDADPLIPELLAELVRRCKREKLTLVVSSYEAALKRFRDLSPETYTGFTPSEARRFVFLEPEDQKTYRPPAEALQVPIRSGGIEVVTPETVARAHRHGVEVHVWTVNDEQSMRRLVRLGVDGIMTDRPDLLAKVLRSERHVKDKAD
jgi:glycerophosphoryl diester phosphodiesterase